MFVLRSKTTGQYLERNSKHRFTDELERARVFSRVSDYKQSEEWLGRFVAPSEGWRYQFKPWTDEERPVEPVRVALAIVKNPNLKNVEIIVS